MATSRRRTGVDRYLLQGERLVLQVREHWIALAEPVATTVAAIALATGLDAVATKTTQAVGQAAWILVLVLMARLAILAFEWYHTWFVATDKRLLLLYGVVTRRVAMMPLAKVTDMSYSRSIPGQLLGYGKFVLESAGQDQALREIPHVAHPDQTYRAICAEIFGVADESPDENPIPPPAEPTQAIDTSSLW